MACVAATAALTADRKDLKDVPPFHIFVELQNKKQAVSEKVKSKLGNFPLLPAAAGYMMPEKMVCSTISKKLCSEMTSVLEGMGVKVAIWEDHSQKVGNRFALGVLLIDYDTDALCQEKGAGWIKRTAARVASDVTPQGIGRALRQVLMQKMMELVPQEVAKQGAEIDIEIPELEESRSFPVTRALVQPAASVVKSGFCCLGSLLPCGRLPAHPETVQDMQPRKRTPAKPSQPLLVADAGAQSHFERRQTAVAKPCSPGGQELTPRGKVLSPSAKALSPSGKRELVLKR